MVKWSSSVMEAFLVYIAHETFRWWICESFLFWIIYYRTIPINIWNFDWGFSVSTKSMYEPYCIELVSNSLNWVGFTSMTRLYIMDL